MKKPILACLFSILLFSCNDVSSEYKKIKNRDNIHVAPAGKMPVYKGEFLRNIAFPVGGLGTGNILLGGRGNMIDLEIFGKADHDGLPPYMTFFTIWAKEEGKNPKVRIAERELLNNFPNPFGVPRQQLSGIKRFNEVTFEGHFPFANLAFDDASFPVEVSLQCYNPFIPMDVENSSLPVAEFSWSFKNTTSRDIDVSLCLNMSNPFLPESADRSTTEGPVVNEFYQSGELKGIRMYPSIDTTDQRYGEVFFSTSVPNPQIKTKWYMGRWWDNSHDFWHDFEPDGQLEENNATIRNKGGQTTVSSLNVTLKLAPGDSASVPFYISWYMPRRKLEANMAFGNEEPREAVVENYYAMSFENAPEVTSYYLQNKDYLYAKSSIFKDILLRSTMPSYVVDALSSNLAAFKTNLFLRLGNGNIHGYEGLGNDFGCCAGNCAHVWNYAQSMAFLFPSLERNVRTVQFQHDTHENGYFCFRTVYPLGDYWFKSVAADGQLGTIMRAYREWKMGGDDDWLQSLWPKIKAAMEFTWKGSGDLVSVYPWMKNQAIPWDHDKDGVITGRQHNTYDIDFYGANMLTGSLYLGALAACSEMARAMNDPSFANECLDLKEKSERSYVDHLWNGSYFEQNFDLPDELDVPTELVYNDSLIKYQFGNGCLSDQLLGQYMAFVSGMGYLMDEDKVKKTLESIYMHNFYRDISMLQNLQRVYAINNEPALVNCTWPYGEKPLYPFVYASEVWTGVEYQVAASLIYADFIPEGLEIVEAVRSRYRGYNRNPWSEIESGDYYARSQSNWAVLLALSGYKYDATTGFFNLQPKINQDKFTSFWSAGSSWGEFMWSKAKFTLTSHFGQFEIASLRTIPMNEEASVDSYVNEKPIPHHIAGDTLVFADPVKLSVGDTLRIIHH